MKRIISLILSVSILIALCPAAVAITFNAQNHSTSFVSYGFSVDDVTGEYYEYYKYVPESAPKQIISKDEYNKAVTELNHGEVIPIYRCRSGQRVL